MLLYYDVVQMESGLHGSLAGILEIIVTMPRSGYELGRIKSD